MSNYPKSGKPIPQISMFEVESANIEAVGYHPETMTLRIKFKSQNIYYDYFKAPSGFFIEMMKSESKGRFFSTQIKGQFKFEKIEL